MRTFCEYLRIQTETVVRHRRLSSRSLIFCLILYQNTPWTCETNPCTVVRTFFKKKEKTLCERFKNTHPNTSSPSSLSADFENFFLLAITDKHIYRTSWSEPTYIGRTTSGFFRTPLRGVTDLTASSKRTLGNGAICFTGLSIILMAKRCQDRNNTDHVGYALEIFVIGNWRSHGRSRTLPVYTHCISFQSR